MSDRPFHLTVTSTSIPLIPFQQMLEGSIDYGVLKIADDVDMICTTSFPNGRSNSFRKKAKVLQITIDGNKTDSASAGDNVIILLSIELGPAVISAPVLLPTIIEAPEAL